MIEEEIISGIWFLPGQEDLHFNGQLKFGPNSFPRLTLNGTLKSNLNIFSITERAYVIWGYDLNGKSISLFGCNRLNWGGTLGIDEAIFNAQDIIIGKHLNSKDSEVFSGARFSYNNLQEWLGTNGFDTKIISADNYNVTYSTPDEISFKLDETVKGRFIYTSKIPYIHSTKLDLLQEVHIELNFERLLNLKTARKYIYDLQRLINLLMFTTSKVNSMNLIIDSFEVRLFYRQSDSDDDDNSLYLVPFRLIGNEFEKVTSAWFALIKTIEPVIGILHASIGKSTGFVHNDFLNIIQAVEAFHRRRIQNTVDLRLKGKEQLNRIISQVGDEDDKEWLLSKLAHSYEPHLRKRLKELIAQNETALFGKKISNKKIDPIINKVVEKRNYYTHYDPTLEKIEDDTVTLLNLTRFLKMLLTYSVFNEIGLNSDFLSDKVYKRFQFNLDSSR